MARLPYFAALTLAGGLIASAVTAPTAFTQPPAPVAGSESPGDTIRELTNQGFDVQINWVAGQPSNIPLSQCTVTLSCRLLRSPRVMDATSARSTVP